jgi:hypothetical protein
MLNNGTAVMLGGIAALGLAVVFVATQGFPSGLGGLGITPSQLIELAPGGDDTAVPDNGADKRLAPASPPSSSAVSLTASAEGSGTGSRSGSGGSPAEQKTHHRGGQPAAQGGSSGGVTASASGGGNGGVRTSDSQASRTAPAPVPAPTPAEDSNRNSDAYTRGTNGGFLPTDTAHGGIGKALGHSRSGGIGEGSGR